MKLASVVLTLLSITAAVNADTWNKKTIITVSDEMQIPGKILPAGTYVLRLVESQANRHIVQVMNQREDKVEATIIAIPNYRLQPTGKSSFGFWETPAGMPKALRSWFYPGDNFGQEFAYPKMMAASLSAMSQQTVPVLTDDSRGNDAQVTIKTFESPAAAPVEIAKAEPVVEAAPAPAPVEAAPPAPAPAPEPVAAAPAPVQVEAPSNTAAADSQGQPLNSSLPGTASPLAAIALGGLLLISAGKSLSVFSNRG